MHFSSAKTTSAMSSLRLKSDALCRSQQNILFVYNSVSQTCLNRYPDQGSNYVLITLNYFAVIAHNIQKTWFWFRITPEDRILPPGDNLIQFGNHWFITTVESFPYSLKCKLGYVEPPHKSVTTEYEPS